MKRTVLIAVAAAFVLAACAIPMQADKAAPVRGAHSPTVYVTVINGKIEAHPDVIPVQDKNVWIYWLLDSSQKKYRFPADAIRINDNDDEFTNCKNKNNGHNQGGHTFACHDKNNQHGQGLAARFYKYTIKLETTDGSAPPPPYDPFIVNH